jgi:hypothetical protein
MLRILDVPQQFLPGMPIQYPPHQGNNPMIEHKCFDFFTKNADLIETDYIYLPIQWTAYHLLNGYGQNVQPLIDFYSEVIKQFPDEKFFTIVQYDGGTLVELPNCTVFASSGSFNSSIGNNSKYVPVPLLCDPHPIDQKLEKKYKASFCGRKTHGLRDQMFGCLSDIDGYVMIDPNSHSITEDNIKIFRDLINNSIFGLCPRGYGPTSFRLYETIQMGSIPIFISDEFWLPFAEYIKWEKLAVLVTPEEIDQIPKIIDQIISQDLVKGMVEYGQMCYNKYLGWDGVTTTIKKIIENEN